MNFSVISDLGKFTKKQAEIIKKSPTKCFYRPSEIPAEVLMNEKPEELKIYSDLSMTSFEHAIGLLGSGGSYVLTVTADNLSHAYDIVERFSLADNISISLVYDQYIDDWSLSKDGKVVKSVPN